MTRFCKGVAERFGGSVELRGLDQRVLKKANEADEQADAQANELRQGKSGGGRPSQATELVNLAKEASNCFTVLTARLMPRSPFRTTMKRGCCDPRAFATGCALASLRPTGSHLVHPSKTPWAFWKAKRCTTVRSRKFTCGLPDMTARFTSTWEMMRGRRLKSRRTNGKSYKIPPVRFRVRGMLDLPRPTRGGRLSVLRKFVNIDSDDDWVLFLGALVSNLRPRGPYPITIHRGEQASAGHGGAVYRALVDPEQGRLAKPAPR